MKTIKLIFLGLMIFSPGVISAQDPIPKIKIRKELPQGIIATFSQKDNKKPIINKDVHIIVHGHHEFFETIDSSGVINYISTPPGTFDVYVSIIGFQSVRMKDVVISANKRAYVTFSLSPNPLSVKKTQEKTKRLTIIRK